MATADRTGLVRTAIENRWAFVPVGILAATVAFAVFVVVFLVNGRGATAAEPDYYRKGVAWDEWRRQEAENGTLRWVVTPSFGASPAGTGLVHLTLAVADKNAVPIVGAAVRAEVIPIADADRRVEVACAESGPGAYGVDVPLRAAGLWEIRTTVEWKGHRYCDRVRRQVAFGPRSAGAAAGGAQP
jgi:hypothetical protein